LQLLEFLIKHGSERVVDDARSHLSLIRMLRQFHYIDTNGKDQGINVRNRSQELVKLLGDVEAIRAERKKARANRNKFGGMEGTGGAFSSGGGGGGRYGGFGSDSYGGYSGGVFGDGGGFGGASDPSDFRDTARRSSRFEEYDEDDDEPSAAPAPRRPAESRAQAKAPQPPPKAQDVDLFDFGDDDVVSSPAAVPSSTAAGKKPATGIDMLGGTAGGDDDDDFDDFQSASPPAAPTAVTTTASTQFVAPKPISAAQGADLTGLMGFTSNTPTPTGSTTMSPPPLSGGSAFAAPAAPLQQQKPSGYQAPTPNYYTSVNAGFNQPSVMSPTSTLGSGARPGMGGSTSSFSSLTSPTSTTTTSPTLAATGKKPAAKSAGGDAFGSLWSTASASAGIQKTAAQKGPNLASMAKEKSSAGIWGTTGTASNNNNNGGFSSNRPANGGNDLLG
jgi:epsin